MLGLYLLNCNLTYVLLFMLLKDRITKAAKRNLLLLKLKITDDIKFNRYSFIKSIKLNYMDRMINIFF